MKEKKQKKEPTLLKEITISTLKDLEKLLSEDFFMVEVEEPHEVIIDDDIYSEKKNKCIITNKEYYLFNNPKEAIDYARLHPSRDNGFSSKSPIYKVRFVFEQVPYNIYPTITFQPQKLEQISYD